jgi:hypothetical protein
LSEIEQKDGFVAAKVNEVTAYSCYASPKSPIATFRALLDKLEQSVRQKQGQIIIADEFNARLAAWMDTTTDSRGEDLSLLMDTLCLDVVNVGSDPTFIGSRLNCRCHFRFRNTHEESDGLEGSRGQERKRPPIYRIPIREPR